MPEAASTTPPVGPPVVVGSDGPGCDQPNSDDVPVPSAAPNVTPLAPPPASVVTNEGEHALAAPLTVTSDTDGDADDVTVTDGDGEDVPPPTHRARSAKATAQMSSAPLRRRGRDACIVCTRCESYAIAGR